MLPALQASAVATEPAVHAKKEFPLLVLGALGVVYGDIGTSPIYAFRQALPFRRRGARPNAAEVLGLLSLIIWALTVTVTVKYIFFVTKADNKGEGGTLSLMALAPDELRASAASGSSAWASSVRRCSSATRSSRRRSRCCRRSRVSTVVAPDLAPWVVPVDDRHHHRRCSSSSGSAPRVSRVFGPVTAVWFLALGCPGSIGSSSNPEVLWALNPAYGITFLITHCGDRDDRRRRDLPRGDRRRGALRRPRPLRAEADRRRRGSSSSFRACCSTISGRAPSSWGTSRGHVDHPFFEMHPGLGAASDDRARDLRHDHRQPGGDLPGAYSLTQQAIALNLLPRMTVLHTSETQSGQIYMPQVNTILLMLVVLLLVVAFGSSSALSNAYGIAVIGRDAGDDDPARRRDAAGVEVAARADDHGDDRRSSAHRHRVLRSPTC